MEAMFVTITGFDVGVGAALAAAPARGQAPRLTSFEQVVWTSQTASEAKRCIGKDCYRW